MLQWTLLLPMWIGTIISFNSYKKPKQFTKNNDKNYDESKTKRGQSYFDLSFFLASNFLVAFVSSQESNFGEEGPISEKFAGTSIFIGLLTRNCVSTIFSF